MEAQGDPPFYASKLRQASNIRFEADQTRTFACPPGFRGEGLEEALAGGVPYGACTARQSLALLDLHTHARDAQPTPCMTYRVVHK